jgi:hypothetical protein
MNKCNDAFMKSGWDISKFGLWTDAWEAALKSVEPAQQSNNIQSDAITLLRRWVSNHQRGASSVSLYIITEAWLEGVS